jgi:hypothetical protein
MSSLLKFQFPAMPSPPPHYSVSVGEDIRKGFRTVNTMYYVLMFGNGKMRPLETILGMGWGG